MKRRLVISLGLMILISLYSYTCYANTLQHNKKKPVSNTNVTTSSQAIRKSHLLMTKRPGYPVYIDSKVVPALHKSHPAIPAQITIATTCQAIAPDHSNANKGQASPVYTDGKDSPALNKTHPAIPANSSITIPAGISSKQNVINLMLLKNTALRISLLYNKTWQYESDSERYIGQDGFFYVSAYTSGNYNAHNLKVKRTTFKNPDMLLNGIKAKTTNLLQIKKCKVAGQDAVFIIYKSTPNEARLFIKYPSNVCIKLRGMIFDYVDLQADKNHIIQIANTLKFISKQ